MTNSCRHVDAHGHLNDPRFDEDRDAALARMRAAGVAAIVVGTDREMSARAIALAAAEPDIWATVGQHPTDTHDELFDEAWYRVQATHPRVVAIGECGLDYYWPTHNKWPEGEKVEKKRQHDLFAQQIALAKKAGKPLMIHGRPTPKTMDAYDDILAILDEHRYAGGGDVHFFVGNTDIAKKFLDRGFTLSFTGVITFTHDYDDVVRFVPLDRILSETDAPYVAPVPYRGKRNESAYVTEVVRAIARIRAISEEEAASQLLENVQRAFSLVLPYY